MMTYSLIIKRKNSIIKKILLKRRIDLIINIK